MIKRDRKEHFCWSNSNFDTEFICREIRGLIITVDKGHWSLFHNPIGTAIDCRHDQMTTAVYALFFIMIEHGNFDPACCSERVLSLQLFI